MGAGTGVVALSLTLLPFAKIHEYGRGCIGLLLLTHELLPAVEGSSHKLPDTGAKQGESKPING